jgi:hypothetical protein
MCVAACIMALTLWRLRVLLAPASASGVSIIALVALVCGGLASYGAMAGLLGLYTMRNKSV